ncbi:MAG TPA: MarR family transcriptional regulator [Acidimicrobiales bacterium]|nr:MarR family transcriptional regulator [Acidimicrobiales bacterium]
MSTAPTAQLPQGARRRSRAADAPSDAATPDDLLASALRIAVMRLARRIRSERSDESMTLTQLSALATVANHGPLSPTALAELERVQPPSMTRVIAHLVERGLVLRVPHPSDGRQAVIELSPAGRSFIDEDRRRRTAWLARVLEELDEPERRALAAAVPLLEQLAGA